MGKTDAVTKEYLRNPSIFADAFNKYLYHGRQVIKPGELRELDAAEIAIPYGSDGAVVPEQRYRDILKLMMTDGNIAYCILGIESQNKVHYAIPVKNMVYDSLQLAHQVTETAKSHKDMGKRKDTSKDYNPSSGEYLSGFYKTDRLLPVLTLVIFFGSALWDGPLTLKEMYFPVDETLLHYMPDYKVNLIAPGQMAEEEIREFASSLKEVFLYIKYSSNKEKLQEVTQREPGFRCLERQAAEVINVTTNSKLKYPEGEDVIDMCTAIQEMREESEAKGKMEGRIEGKMEGRIEGRIEGKIEGTIEMCREFGASLQDTIQRIAKKFNLPLQQSEQEVRKYWK